MDNLTLQQAFDSWEQGIKPLIVEQYGEDDTPALSESWNNYTDELCKDGQLTELQYKHCPAHDEAMPDNDREYILGCMGVMMECTEIDERTDGTEWDDSASHYRIEFSRNEGGIFSVEYSQGSAHWSEPGIECVIACLLTDADVYNCSDFKEWAECYGYDIDSRKAEKTYKACLNNAEKVWGMFSSKELDDLGQLFQDY